MSYSSGCSVSCHLGAKAAREVYQDLPRRAQQGRTKFFSHAPEVKRGSMGLLVPPFQGPQEPAKNTQEPAKNTPSSVITQEPVTTFGTAHYRMAATPSKYAEILLTGFLHAKKGT